MDPTKCKTYDEVVQHLGHAVPCYDRRDGKHGGCHVNDDANIAHCNGDDGCLLLKMYSDGYAAALADAEKPRS